MRSRDARTLQSHFNISVSTGGVFVRVIVSQFVGILRSKSVEYRVQPMETQHSLIRCSSIMFMCTQIIQNGVNMQKMMVRGSTIRISSKMQNVATIFRLLSVTGQIIVMRNAPRIKCFLHSFHLPPPSPPAASLFTLIPH